MSRDAVETSLDVCPISERLLSEAVNCLGMTAEYSAVYSWLQSINSAFGVKLGVRESLFPSCARACFQERARIQGYSWYPVCTLTGEVEPGRSDGGPDV